MKIIQRYVAIVALVLASGVIGAQTVSPVDFMRYNPYQMRTNPAADLPYESVMSLLIGNFGLDIQNSTLRYDNLFEFDEQGHPATVNLRQFANSMKAKNFFGVNANMEVFTLYRRLNKGILTIDYGAKVQGDVGFSDGLFNLLGYGNGAFVGEDNPVNIDLSANASIYQEFAVGYQFNVNKKLSLGVKGKVLFGFANVTTDAFNVQLITDPDSYALRIKEHIAVRSSFPGVFYVNDDGILDTQGHFNVADLFKNPGFGVDLAAEYRFDEKWSAVAAVRDLGFIRWRLNNFAMTGDINDAGQYYDNGDFLFNGISFDQLQLIANDDDYREKFMDSLKQYFQVDFATMDKYNKMLSPNLLLRANYDITPCNRFSAQLQGQFLGSGFRPAFTLAYCGSFWNNVNVCATYTVAPHSYDNIGFGFSWMIATCNIYLTTNNILAFFKPMNTSSASAQLGIVFNLWLPERRYVKPAKNEPQEEEGENDTNKK